MIKRNYPILVLVAFLIVPNFAHAQKHGKYVSAKPGFYQNEILQAKIQAERSEKQSYSIVYDKISYPTDTSDFQISDHFPPVSQGATGTCWCFATISMMESEIQRISGKKLKLSEMYIVYWEYVERAKAYIKNRGDVYFAQGSEATSVPRIMDMYGIVPETVYPGKPTGQEFHNHSAMFTEMNTFLSSLEKSQAWNAKWVESTIISILNHYLGAPPETFTYKGITMTPMEFLNDITGLAPKNYFSFMSTQSQPYNQMGELIEPDNWWHCDEYYNIHVDEMIHIIDKALENGYTISICGDVSEPGFDKYKEIGIIPDFDIPPHLINEDAREYRLSNRSTTDDHCMHLVGHTKKDKWKWYLVKDSGSGAFDGPNKGYRFIREDYIKLKMMNIMVHKVAASDVLDKIIK